MQAHDWIDTSGKQPHAQYKQTILKNILIGDAFQATGKKKDFGNC